MNSFHGCINNMEKEELQSAIHKAKTGSHKKNFKQTVDLIINLRGLDLKKPDHQVDSFITLPHSKGKKVKVCALVGPEMMEQAKTTCDSAISLDDFEKFKDKKQVKKLASGYDYFIAQANIMAKIATVFGRVLGPRGKMPNPKSGCVVPPNANLKPLYEKLQKTVRINSKTAPLIQCAIGSEEMKEADIVENGMTVYKSLLQALPNERHNVKDIYIKLTMGTPVKIGETEEKK